MNSKKATRSNQREQKPPNVDEVESKKIRKVNSFIQVNIPLQARPHLDNFKNKHVSGVAKYILRGNNTAQKKRQSATNGI